MSGVIARDPYWRLVDRFHTTRLALSECQRQSFAVNHGEDDQSTPLTPKARGGLGSSCPGFQGAPGGLDKI
jgi:hypothetical protein